MLDNGLAQNELNLRMASSLFAGSQQVTQDEFQSLGNSMDINLGSITGLEQAITGFAYLKRIRRNKRSAFEQSHFPLLALPFPKAVTPSTNAYEYYPILLTTGAVLDLQQGMDLGSFPATYEAVSTAFRLPGQAIMSPAFRTSSGDLAAIMALGVQSADDVGILVSFLDLQALFDDLGSLMPSELHVSLSQVETEESSQSKRTPVISLGPKPDDPIATQMVRLSHGQARWELLWSSDGPRNPQNIFTQAQTVILSGSLVSLLLAFIFFLLLREHKQVREQVKSRTRELEQAKRIADNASLAKSQILANVSHELRTPLNAIIGFSEVLQDEIFGNLGNDRYREYASDIKISGEHLLELINDLLDMTQIESGKVVLKDDKLEIGALFSLCERVMAPQFEEAQITLQVQPTHSVVWLTADERRLKQVLINLLSNARKFTLPGGKVTLGFQVSDPEGLSITVEDSGIGMSEQDIPKALEPFGQIDSAASRKFRGTGLGLPLSREIMRLHDGDLKVTSELGRGTKVTCTLPADRIEQVVPLPSPSS
ncbi:ATP-binding protein [Rhodovibrionaceae bacterium A322]